MKRCEVGQRCRASLHFEATFGCQVHTSQLLLLLRQQGGEPSRLKSISVKPSWLRNGSGRSTAVQGVQHETSQDLRFSACSVSRRLRGYPRSRIREGEAPAEPCFSAIRGSAGASPSHFSDSLSVANGSGLLRRVGPVEAKYPDLDLNQGLDLRRVQCNPLHHRDKSRRLDSHQHPPVYKTGAFLSRATSADHVLYGNLRLR